MKTHTPAQALKPAAGPVVLLIGTRKGAFIVRADRSRRTWKLSGPIFLGHIVHHLVLDPRDRRTMLMAARTGHLGPTVFRSTDAGKTWQEAQAPPAFPKVPEGQKGQVVDHVFWLTPGHTSEPDAWYADTSPKGLFRSEDGGNTWESVKGFNEHPFRSQWTGGEQDGTPDGPKLHSIIVDPRDPMHLYFAMSGGGIHESLDGGQTFAAPLNVSRTPGLANAPAIAVDGRGRITVAWQDDRTGTPQIFAAHSADGGVTFSPPAQVARTFGFAHLPALAASRDRTFLVWHDNSPGDFEIFFLALPVTGPGGS